MIAHLHLEVSSRTLYWSSLWLSSAEQLYQAALSCCCPLLLKQWRYARDCQTHGLEALGPSSLRFTTWDFILGSVAFPDFPLVEFIADLQRRAVMASMRVGLFMQVALAALPFRVAKLVASNTNLLVTIFCLLNKPDGMITCRWSLGGKRVAISKRGSAMLSKALLAVKVQPHRNEANVAPLAMVQSRSIGHWLGGSWGISVSMYRFGIGRYVK